MFGTDERVREIQPTKDPQYKLCYKSSTYFFLAGCYVTDDGYVLQKVGESKAYIVLDAGRIRQLQQEGVLPTPLPPYSLSFSDYLVGYSNWIILGFVVGILFIKWAWTKRRRKVPTFLTDQSSGEPGAAASKGVVR
jgi:hypothetical protein